ncbi:MAG: hypothetical protein ACRC18_06570 [Cetobacterium sp.]
MGLNKIRIREDNYIDDRYEDYECRECGIKFKDKDIILEIDLYESYWRFCSEKCLTNWIMSDIEKKQIEVYPMPDEVKQKRELKEAISNMKPNTQISIGELRVEYHKAEGLTEHYIVSGILQKMFLYRSEVVNYILKQI